MRARGALLFPSVPDVPVDAYRAHLYTPAELYDGLATGDYADTLDARVHAWSRDTGSDLYALLAQSLHDFSVDDALDQLVDGRRLVGVMGGHALERGTDGYTEAARLGRSLTASGLTVATGGGPGAMEAANLGAYLSGHGDDVMTEALDVLAAVPTYTPSVGDWARSAFDVRERFPDGTESLGVPTWFYGHEPPNAFAEPGREVLQERDPRGRPAARLHGRHRVPARSRRHGAGGLPGRLRELLRRGRRPSPRWCSSARTTGPPSCRSGRCSSGWPPDREMAGSVHLVDDLDEVAGLLTD